MSCPDGIDMRDTTPEAAALQTKVHRALASADRLSMAIQMSNMTRELSMTRIRREHPDWSELAVKRELLRYAFESKPLPVPLR